jgi:hypothetical protein
MTHFKEIAFSYIASGLNVVPANEYKMPMLSDWKKYQSLMLDSDKYLAFDTCPKIGIICGAISGGLEVLDFDEKYLRGCYDSYMVELVNSFPELCNKLVIETTPSGGFHIYYRCEVIGKNAKLAGLINSEGKKDYFIETRGEGGFIVCAPSSGYGMIQGDLCHIPTISQEERIILLSIAISQSKIQAQSAPTFSQNSGQKGDSPFSKYNERGKNHALSLLLNNGFVQRKVVGDKVLLTHPQSTKNDTNAIYNGNLWIWGNCSDFEPEKNIRPADIFIKYMANGDLKKAAQLLKANGF